MVIVVQTTTMVPMICGTLMRKKTRNGPAPSMIAASIVSSGTPRRAAERITMAKPVWIQTRITMRKKLFQNGSCSGSSGSSPMLSRIALMMPISGSPA